MTPTPSSLLLCLWRYGLVPKRDALVKCPLCGKRTDDGHHPPSTLPPPGWHGPFWRG